MRLKSVYISEYKNLKDFNLTFDGDSFIDVFVGKNGSGKSNFFEALIEIFRFLYEFDSRKEDIGFNFKIEYEIENIKTIIEWVAGKLTINEEQDRKTIGKTPLPENVLIYYSGHNDKVTQLVKKYEITFKSRIKGATVDESRRFFGIDSKYKSLLLTVLLVQGFDSKSNQFIRRKLEIASCGDTFSIELCRPSFADGKLKILKVKDIEHLDKRTHFWGADGITKDFLDDLISCVKGEFTHSDLYSTSNDIYKITIDITLFKKKFSKLKISDIFRKFDNLYILGMLSTISMSQTLTNGSIVEINQFSDGQFQSVYIYAVMELFKDRNCLTFLDEPDSFLHPEWQFEFLKQVFEITDTESSSNHILMTSHSAATLTSLKEPSLNVFEICEDVIKMQHISKSDAIKLLSGGIISLLENEIIMSTNTFLKNTTQPVLFTEGITDEYILDIAWQKLYERQKRTFCIHSSYDRNTLRVMFARDDLNSNHPRRVLFALFDFDTAFEDWNGLWRDNFENVVTNVFSGLTKKRKTINHFAMLLPVPNIEVLKRQVIDSDDIPWGRGNDSHISMELLFYNEDWPENSNWFIKRKTSCGGEIIEFCGDKIKFAQNIVPILPAETFEVFRPMFEFIKSKC